MVKDIVSRLREFSSSMFPYGSKDGTILFDDAALEIERLNQEIQRLNYKVERLTNVGDHLYKVIKMLRGPGSPTPPPEISIPMNLWWEETHR